jgi:ariadne-1
LVNTPEWRNNEKKEERKSLQSYLSYFNMYKEHDRNSKFEDATRVKAKKQMEELRQSVVDVTFIERAYDLLHQMRGVLKFTYVYAFYTQDVTKKALFELHQSQLEMIAERISRELNKVHVEDLDQLAIKNLTRVADSALKHLLIENY